MTSQADKEVRQYGDGDMSFQSAGGEQGIRKLVDAFYAAMSTLPEARIIRDMHSDNLDVSNDKLARFLCGWLGGPKLFREKYGQIQIPKAHAHLPIGKSERDAWLKCMETALSEQDYPVAFKKYLLKEFFRPADRSRTIED